MIEVVFTIDYEIYGNGKGSLKEHVYDPACLLQKMFNQAGVKLVFFVEAAELEIIEKAKSDPTIGSVKKQIKDLYAEGHEIALHLHPQWYNGNYKNGTWQLDNLEYNLCVLSEKRITQIIDKAINYLRSVLSDPTYVPFSFRAGNWLFQPTQPTAKILFSRGIKIDSSVFKGGLQRQNNLDYRTAVKNGYFWKFREDINKPANSGEIMEVPIYSEMVPPWRMVTRKRVGLQTTARENLRNKINRLLNSTRPLQPLKLDFCRMTINELDAMMINIIRDDQKEPRTYKPIVAIGHTKDLVDFDTVKNFLSYLKENNIKITTLKDAYNTMLS